VFGPSFHLLFKGKQINRQDGMAGIDRHRKRSLLAESGRTMRMDDVGDGRDAGREGHPRVPGGGTLVIRAWHEHDAQLPGFRARITYDPASGDEHTTVYAADSDQVLAVVKQWLLTQAPAPGGN
jgi:hypothetical protein